MKWQFVQKVSKKGTEYTVVRLYVDAEHFVEVFLSFQDMERLKLYDEIYGKEED